jgi:hypothetical protein
MRTGINSNAKYASTMMCMGSMSEPSLEDCSGIYLGRTSIYRTPFFLDVRRLLNPHIAVLGMSGAGKTYFLKSLIARNALCCNTKVLVLDWNGEYGDVVAFLGGTVIDSTAVPASFDTIASNPISSIDMSTLKNDTERKRTAARLLDMLIDEMHSMRLEKDLGRIVVLDEAWRFIESAGDIGALFREGRKYGIGIVTATQLTSDVNKEVLSNAACTVLFRLQNSADYAFLLDAEMIGEYEKQRILQLPQGSCMLSMAARETSDHMRFFIERIEGVDTRVYGIRCDAMNLKISGVEFQKITERYFVCSDVRQKIESYTSSNDSELEATAFVRFLLRIGLHRQEVVPYLRALGARDATIAEVYERAGQ